MAGRNGPRFISLPINQISISRCCQRFIEASIAFFFAFAGLAKAGSLFGFSEAIRDLIPLPGPVALGIALATVAIELYLSCGLLLASPERRPSYMLAGASVLLVYTIFLATIGEPAECPCFAIGSMNPIQSALDSHPLARNVAGLAIFSGYFFLRKRMKGLNPAAAQPGD